MKKLFLIPVLSVLSALCLVSCLEVGGGNREEGYVLAAISYSEKELVPTLRTARGEFSSSSITGSDLMPGDCVLAHITIDWDHQPKGDSLTRATVVEYATLGQSYATVQRDFNETVLDFDVKDLLPIEYMTPQAYHAILNGKVFFGFGYTAPDKQEMDFIMTVKPSETEGGKATVYIVGKKLDAPSGSNINNEALYAIDMFSVISELGEITTTRENSVDLTVQELKFTIRYCTGVDENNIPKYQMYGTGNESLAIYLK